MNFTDIVYPYGILEMYRIYPLNITMEILNLVFVLHEIPIDKKRTSLVKNRTGTRDHLRLVPDSLMTFWT